MKVHTSKSYYGKIFFESLTQRVPANAIILLSGFPSKNNYDEIMDYFYKKGFNVFYPKYPGTYQSKGKFLKTNLVKDLCKFIDSLRSEKTINLWDMKPINFKIKNFIICASSFGGVIACGIASQRNIKKLILFSPVLNFKKLNQRGDEEDPKQITSFTKRAFKNCIRFDFNNIQKAIKKIPQINPEKYSKTISSKILILHDPKDKVVSIKHIQDMGKKFKFKLIKTSTGHGMSKESIKKNEKEINKFLSS